MPLLLWHWFPALRVPTWVSEFQNHSQRILKSVVGPDQPQGKGRGTREGTCWKVLWLCPLLHRNTVGISACSLSPV